MRSWPPGGLPVTRTLPTEAELEAWILARCFSNITAVKRQGRRAWFFRATAPEGVEKFSFSFAFRIVVAPAQAKAGARTAPEREPRTRWGAPPVPSEATGANIPAQTAVPGRTPKTHSARAPDKAARSREACQVPLTVPDSLERMEIDPDSVPLALFRTTYAPSPMAEKVFPDTLLSHKAFRAAMALQAMPRKATYYLLAGSKHNYVSWHQKRCRPILLTMALTRILLSQLRRARPERGPIRSP